MSFYDDEIARVMPTREDVPGMYVDSYSFSGYLSRENIEGVFNFLKAALTDATYTWVANYEYNGYRPEVRIKQRADKFTLHNDHHFSICDTYGVWGLSIDERGEVKRGEAKPKWAVYVQAEYRNGWTFQISHNMPNGKHAWWTIAVDPDSIKVMADEKDEDGWQEVTVTVPEVGSLFTMFHAGDLTVLPGRFDGDDKLLDTIYNEIMR